MSDPLQTLAEYVDDGGFIMWPLVVATFVLWYALGYRFLTLQRGSVRSVRILVERYRKGASKPPRGVIDSAVVAGLALVRTHARYEGLRRLLDDRFADVESELKRGRILIASIVAVAPLAGLLGTVTGMIETFDSLGDMSLFSQSGGIAGGISQALFTTQMGLSIAVPGIIAGKVLDRRQQTIEHELAQLKDILCIEVAPSMGGTRRSEDATS
jgi:biopolymer transport protein ExbB